MPRSARIIEPSKLGDFGLRLIGTTDIDGNGTQHAVDQVDPIVLFDFVKTRTGGKSAFRPHPHFGLTAMSFLPSTGAWGAWDSLAGESDHELHPGGLYYVHAGSQAFHHEFATPETTAADEVVEFVQLVWNATDETDVRTVILQPDELPVLASEDHIVRVMAGNLCGLEAPQPFSHRDIIYAYVQLLSDRSLELDLPRTMNGMLFPIEGGMKVNEEELGEQRMMILGDDGGTLSVFRSDPNQPTRFLIAAGEPTNRPFYKLLGLGGFIIGETENGVRAMMTELEKQAEGIKKEVPHYFPEQYL